MENNFWTYYAEAGSVITGKSYFSDTRKMLYGGEMESAPNLDLLTKAKELIKTKSELEVWKETGWIFNRNDSGWRFEINDSSAVMKLDISELIGNYKKDKYKYLLLEVWGHDFFYYLYPQAKEIVFFIVDRPHQSQIVLAESGYKNKIFVILLTINFEKYEIIKSNYEGSRSANQRVNAAIAHEAQHYLQGRHDFGKGEGIGEITQRVQRISDRIRRRATSLRGVDRQRALVKADKYNGKWVSDISYFIYSRLSAEKEARDVSDRINLTEGERKSVLPYPINPKE